MAKRALLGVLWQVPLEEGQERVVLLMPLGQVLVEDEGEAEDEADMVLLAKEKVLDEAEMNPIEVLDGKLEGVEDVAVAFNAPHAPPFETAAPALLFR